MANSPFLTALERHQLATSSKGRLSDERKLFDRLQNDIRLHTDPLSGLTMTSEINETGAQLRELEMQRKAGADKALLSKLTTLSSQSEMSKRINTASSSSNVYMQSLGKVNIPRARLESDYSGQMSQIANLNEDLKGMAGDIGNPETLQIYKQKVAQMTQLESRAALNKTSMKTQSQMGLDPRGIIGSAQGAISRVSGTVGRFDLDTRAGKGEFGSLQQETDKLTGMFRDLQTSLENYKNASEAGVDAQEGAADRLKTITAAVGEQEGIVGAIRRGGGAGGMSGLGKTQAFLNIANNALSAGSSFYQNTQISQPKQIMENQTIFANMQNQQYDRIGSMVGGDQMAFLKTMQMDTFRSALAEKMFGRSQTMQMTNIAGDVLGAAGNIAQGVAAGSLMGPLAGIAAGSGALNNIGSIGSGISDIYSGVSAGREAADFANKSEVWFQAVKGIPARQLQVFEDQSRGAYEATTGFGTQSSGMMEKLIDTSKKGLISRAARVGVDRVEALELTALGGQVIGGQDFDSESIIGAGKFKELGLGSRKQYMALLGQLTNVGGRDTNMQEMLSKAVASGMDDSKSITSMVSATVSLSERGAVQGVVGANISGMLMRGVSGIGRSDLTMSQKMKMGTTAVGNFDALLSKTGTDIFDIREFGALSEMLPDASHEELQELQKAGVSDFGMFRTLLNKPKNSRAYKLARESLKTSGYENVLTNADGEIDKKTIKNVLEEKIKNVTGSTAGYGSTLSSKARQELQKGIVGGLSLDDLDLTRQERSIIYGRFKSGGGYNALAGLANLSGDTSGADLSEGTRGFRASLVGRDRVKAMYQSLELDKAGSRAIDLGNMLPQDAMSKESATFREFEESRLSPQERRLRGMQKFFSGSQTINEMAGSKSLNITDEERMKQVARNEAPKALSFEKQSKDFSDGVIVFEEGVKKFNALVRTMERGSQSREATTGSERSNKRVEDYVMSKTGVGF